MCDAGTLFKLFVMAFLSNTISYEISVLIEVAFPVTEKQSEKNSL